MPHHEQNPTARRRELAARNRVVMAEREDWPEGTVSACEQIEQRNPGWGVGWLSENTIKGFERPAGFRAVREGLHAADVFATTTEGVQELIAAAPPPEHDPNDYCNYCAGPRPWRAGFPKRAGS